jgi:ribonuclease HI
MKGLVLYVDGGSKNPGPSGYGVHGYHYDNVVNAKPIGLGSILATTQGYANKENAKEGTTGNVVVELTTDCVVGKGECVAVSPTKYVDMYGTVGLTIEGQRIVMPDATNNRAEATAAIMALKYIVAEKPECAVIRPDSEYVRRGITEWLPGWVRRNWTRPDGTSIANADIWQEINEVLGEVKQLGIPIRYTWIKGHSGDTGNERADKLATLGVNCAIRNKDYHAVEASPPEGFHKYATEKHPFLAHRRCYFNTLSGSNRPGEYYLGDHGKDDEQQGKRISDASCSVVRIEEPDTVLEMIRNYQATVSRSADILYLAYLDRIFSADIHQDLNTYGEMVIEPLFSQRTDLTIKRGKDVVVALTHEQNPPRISWRVIDSLTLLSDVLDQFLNEGKEIVSTEITEVIYEQLSKAPKAKKKVKKGDEVQETIVEEPLEVETKLRAMFNVGCPSIKVQGQYRFGTEIVKSDFTLSTGIDILDRNSLKRLEEKNPKVYLITWNEGENIFRYATVVTAGKDVGIWAGVHSNLRVLAKS